MATRVPPPGWGALNRAELKDELIDAWMGPAQRRGHPEGYKSSWGSCTNVIGELDETHLYFCLGLMGKRCQHSVHSRDPHAYISPVASAYEYHEAHAEYDWLQTFSEFSSFRFIVILCLGLFGPVLGDCFQACCGFVLLRPGAWGW